jgi:hypothetical protein
MTDTDVHALAAALTKKLADEGKLVEAGFAAMQVIMLRGASEGQISDMRLAYMAGAEHVFSSMMSVLDPGEEPTDADMKRVELIYTELQRWREVLAARVARAKGRA